jgi:hypothetical protein
LNTHNIQDRYQVNPFPPAIFYRGKPNDYSERRYEFYMNSADYFIKINYVNGHNNLVICEIPRGNGYNTKNIFIMDNELLVELISFYGGVGSSEYSWTFKYLAILIKIAWLYTQVNKITVNEIPFHYSKYFDNYKLESTTPEMRFTTDKSDILLSIRICSVEKLNVTKTLDDFINIMVNNLLSSGGEKYLVPKNGLSSAQKLAITNNLCTNFDVFKMLVRAMLKYSNNL